MEKRGVQGPFEAMHWIILEVGSPICDAKEKGWFLGKVVRIWLGAWAVIHDCCSFTYQLRCARFARKPGERQQMLLHINIDACEGVGRSVGMTGHLEG